MALTRKLILAICILLPAHATAKVPSPLPETGPWYFCGAGGRLLTTTNIKDANDVPPYIFISDGDIAAANGDPNLRWVWPNPSYAGHCRKKQYLLP
jgi:hypothetical protein